MSQFLVTLLQLVSFVVWVGFIVAYHAMSSGDWRRSDIGRNLMGMAAAFALILFLGLVRTVFGIYPGRDALLVAAYVFSAYVGIRRIGILSRVSHEDRRRADLARPSAALDYLDPVPDAEDV